MAMETDDDITWLYKDDTYNLSVLCVSYFFIIHSVLSNLLLILQSTFDHTEGTGSTAPSVSTNRSLSRTPGLQQPNPTALIPMPKDEFAALLKIDSAQLAKSDGTLTGAYAKYKEYIKTDGKLKQLVSESKWPAGYKHYTMVDLIEVFAPRSTWYETYRIFNRVASHPTMRDWLENGNNRPEDIDVWDEVKTHYTFVDLKSWLDKAEKQKVQKRKGKAGHRQAKIMQLKYVL